MANDIEIEKIDKIIQHKFSTDIFIDQKRKISELLVIHDSNASKRNTDNLSNNLIINSKSKSKFQSNNDNKLQPKSTQFELSPFKAKDLSIGLWDFDCWEYSSFDYEIIESEDVPIVNTPYWPYEELEKEGFNKEKGVEIRNIILKSSCLFNLER